MKAGTTPVDWTITTSIINVQIKDYKYNYIFINILYIININYREKGQ